jgi:hypothetical protein
MKPVARATSNDATVPVGTPSKLYPPPTAVKMLLIDQFQLQQSWKIASFKTQTCASKKRRNLKFLTAQRKRHS